MARLGEIAKEKFTEIMRQAFGDRFLGIQDKKIYVLMPDGDNGDTQLSITLTCPKTGIETNADKVSEFDDEAVIIEIMKSLNLIPD